MRGVSIAINVSHTHVFADGLSSGEREKLEATLRPNLLRRVVHAENLALEYLEVRLPEMKSIFKTSSLNE